MCRNSEVVIFFFFCFADVDECTTSFPVCYVNADCQNTLGSYLCSCKDDFSGDGKTCLGEDVYLRPLKAWLEPNLHKSTQLIITFGKFAEKLSNLAPI